MTEHQIRKAAQEVDISQRPITVLCVDDEVFNLEIMEKHLTKAGYSTICAPDAQSAYEILTKSRQRIDIVLLDRMMPGVDGIQLLRKMKSEPTLAHIPVILQTAKGGSEEAAEGIQAGAYYYVTKPYAAKLLLSVVEAAVREFREHMLLHNQMNQHQAVLNITHAAEYRIKTMEEARLLAAYFASFTQDPGRYIMGVTALLVNSVEHGTLGMGLERKYDLLLNGGWEEEIQKRQNLPENKEKYVQVLFKPVDKGMQLTIRDMGQGFNWRNYLDFDPSRMTEPNGRGVAIANITNPGNLMYNEAGNEANYKLPVAF